MNVSHLAVVVYGAITILLAFAFGYIQGSTWGMVFALLAVGLTYIFQVIEAAMDANDSSDTLGGVILTALWGAVALLIIVSGLTSLIIGG